jgi:protein-S-isoprenylcysteine O-methyltransferase Ste14
MQVVPLSLMLSSLGLMVLLCRLWPVAVLLRPPVTLLGLVPLAAGICLLAAGIHRLGKARTTIVPFRAARRLVTDGPYRYSRNPMYLGDVLVLLGVWLLLGALSSSLPLAAFVLAADRWFIPREESMLSRSFPEEFEEYRRRTRRWF